ncbi:TraR/DksA C4-type zinc finger protein [Rhizobium sp. EC-SD404]|uniref:TraR/DksA family transcriptional regulator n=1 Tax=Rhizobium sp. EC-SD404 TaxID=2038389 RepID=UPI00125929F2|nr:TraR/DksA C4-type zinc finger protein [Rhizobium sp. EC-SD404]VVS96556.1 Dimethylmenaquinone methyltransferase [Rhizobium sp. EC-SD404]
MREGPKKPNGLDLDSMRRVMEARREELDRRLSKIGVDLAQPGDRDLEDQAIQRENDEVLEEMGEAGVEELRQIEAALTRVEKGTYGVCTRCGERIDEQRLKTLPSTPFCVACATEL